MGKSCVFLGHRWSIPTAAEKALMRQLVIRLITEEQVDDFIFGRYGAFDTCAYEIVSALKKIYPHIRRVLALAYIPQNQEEAEGLKSAYEHVYLPDNTEVGPPKFAISRRNRTLAKECDFMICYVLSRSGGAYAAMRTAKRNQKTVFNLMALGED